MAIFNSFLYVYQRVILVWPILVWPILVIYQKIAGPNSSNFLVKIKRFHQDTQGLVPVLDARCWWCNDDDPNGYCNPLQSSTNHHSLSPIHCWLKHLKKKKTGWWLTYPSETYESQLVWWNSQYMETWNSCSKPPTSHILVVYIHQFRENHQPTLSICSWKVHTTLVVTVIHAAVSFNQLLTAAVADSCWLWPWQIGKFPLKRWLLSLWEFSRWMQMV